MSTVPAGACDSHIHFYDARYPAAATALLRPPDAGPDEYRALQRSIGLERLVVVQPTTYGLDNSCQLDAMAEFGDQARGVMVVDETATHQELDRLTALGVRGARFHMLPGGSVPWTALEPVAALVAPHGWHIQLQLNGRDLARHRDRLLALPCDVVIDHVGRFMPPVPASAASFDALSELLGSGRCWVKLSAPYESSVTGPPEYTDVVPLIDTLVTRFPDRLVWASNWPHPGQSQPPCADALHASLARWLPTPELRREVLVHNPTRLYRFDLPIHHEDTP